MERSLWSVPDRPQPHWQDTALASTEPLHPCVSTVSLDLHGAAGYQWLMKPQPPSYALFK